MKISDHLQEICDCLANGLSPRQEACAALAYSLEQAKLAPDTFSPESLHVTKTSRDACGYPEYPRFAKEVCIELASLVRDFHGVSRSEARELAAARVERFEKLVAAWESRRGSQGDKPPAEPRTSSFSQFCADNPIGEKYTHNDRAKAWKREHPEDKRPLLKIRRSSERFPKSRNSRPKRPN